MFLHATGDGCMQVRTAGRVITLLEKDPTASDRFVIELTTAIRDSCG